jgi:hypothetical protein
MFEDFFSPKSNHSEFDAVLRNEDRKGEIKGFVSAEHILSRQESQNIVKNVLTELGIENDHVSLEEEWVDESGNTANLFFRVDDGYAKDRFEGAEYATITYSAGMESDKESDSTIGLAVHRDGQSPDLILLAVNAGHGWEITGRNEV